MASTARIVSAVQSTPDTATLLLRRPRAPDGGTDCAGERREDSQERLQAKLAINGPGDAYEQEADRVADEVMAAPSHPVGMDAPSRIQRFRGPSVGQVGTAPASVDRALGSPGTPLEPALRHDMEQRFGCDLSWVRVHSGAAAEQSARDVAARAYTVGHHIVFGAGRFAPATREGRHLVAHELTHVLQQTDPAALAGNRRSATPTTGAEVRLARQPVDIESVRSVARDLVEQELPGTATSLPLDLERALRRIAGRGGEAGNTASVLLGELGSLTNIASEQRDLNATNIAAREFLDRHGMMPQGRLRVRGRGVEGTIDALDELARTPGGEASAKRARELASELRELSQSLAERQWDHAQYSAPKTKPDVTGKAATTGKGSTAAPATQVTKTPATEPTEIEKPLTSTTSKVATKGMTGPASKIDVSESGPGPAAGGSEVLEPPSGGDSRNSLSSSCSS